MRIALLFMAEPVGIGQTLPRAFLQVAGASVAQHQLSMARGLDCHRIICIAKGMSPELIAFQHEVEHAGLQFTVASGGQSLVGLVSENDELIVISEGLYADTDTIKPLIEDKDGGTRSVVLVQPVEGALADGFERIDIDRATAGLMRISGDLVQRLSDLPAEYEVASALTRIALQNGAVAHEIPLEARSGASWRMVRNEAEAYALEDEWLRSRFGERTYFSPGLTVARYGVLSFGSSLLHAGNASNVASIAVLIVIALSGVFGWFGLAWAGFLLVGIAWLLVEASRMLRSAERHARGMNLPAIPRADALVWLVDAAFAFLILLDMARFPGESLLGWLCMPAILMLIVKLVSRIVDGATAAWLGDRAGLALLLAFASMFGEVLFALRAICLILLIIALFMPSRGRS